MSRTPQTVFIGAGAVATVLARRMASRGYPIAAVLSRTKASAAVLAEQVGAPVASSRIQDLPEGARRILLCVPDDAIEEVVAQLQELNHPWEECVVAHTAGALSSEVLDPLARQGAAVVSLHPVQTFQRASPPDIVEEIIVTLEGDEHGVEALRPLVSELGASPVTIEGSDRATIHLAAAMASNFFVTLLSAAVEVLGRAGLNDHDALRLLQPLVESTWKNVLENRPEEALTGPIQRGDVETLRKHRSALQGELSHLAPLYEAVARETVRLAVKKGTLTTEQMQAVYEVLDEFQGE